MDKMHARANSTTLALTLTLTPLQHMVMDKMHKRWKQKIDIYMGNDVQAALDWGVREVTIHWTPRTEDD